ncbi:MAG: hypothetical protein ACPGWR_05045 [Ardenticatenaceae bacterium]
MRDQTRFIDAMQTNFIVKCPACEQKFIFSGLTVQFKEEMACTQCNALFKLEVNGKKGSAKLVSPPTGAPLGRAKGAVRH